ncbi:MAG: single-stranded DNA-binding protein [Treponema sp.]|jgi:single-strand DNA-binding protein|nr:single-stranded DNA-binding protein [Treponema sp.]
MADLNHVTIIGRLTRDAELKYISSGQAVCKFSIASNYRKKDGDQWKDEANFFDIVLWGRQGETLNQYLVKGKMVGVEGELRQDRWQQDGQNRSKVEIVASNIQLLSSSNTGGGGSPGGGQSQQWNRDGAAAPAAGTREPEAPAGDGFTDDIPF